MASIAPSKSMVGQPPVVRSAVPYIGSMFAMLRDPLGFALRVRERYGPIATIVMGPRRFHLLQGADGIRQVLWEKGDAYPKPKLGMAQLEPLLGRSVATLTDPKEWEASRRFVLPLFTPRMLQAYFDEALSSIAEEVERLVPVAKSGQVIDMYDTMHAATFRVLIRTLFRSGIDKDEVDEFIHLFDDVTAYINARYVTLGMPIEWALPSTRRGKRALDQLNRRVYRLIAERRAAGPSATPDMLDALIGAQLPDGTTLDDRAIRDNCMTLLFGGHETTAGSLTWAWGLLSTHPDKRRRLQECVDAALGDPASPNPPVLADLGYVGQVFTEAMRLYPMFSMLFREASVDDVIENRQVRAGDMIAFSANTVQRSADVWDQPLVFEPERHDPQRPKPHKSGFLAFSQGKRACIGERMARMEGTLMLALLSHRFEFDLVGELPRPTVRMSLKPTGGMMMKVRERLT